MIIQLTNMHETQKYLLELGLSESEIGVYLSMVAGSKTAREIMKVSQLKRPTVYYAISCLEKRGLVSKSNKDGDNTFTLEPVERLNIIAEEKLNETQNLKNNIEKILPNLKNKISPENKKPAVTFFEGKEAVKRMIMSSLYCKNKMMYSIAPKDNFFFNVGTDFVELFIKERKRKEIKTKNLWDIEVDKKIIKQYYGDLSEIRTLPKSMESNFTTTIFLYDDKTLYISSLKNSYCILITSKEHHDMMLSIFSGLWQVSKPN